MRHKSMTCDWCGEEPARRYLSLHVGHIGGFATHEGARFDFDFCDYACMDEWRAHECCSKRVVDSFAASFAQFSDDELRASDRVGSDRELIRRGRQTAHENAHESPG